MSSRRGASSNALKPLIEQFKSISGCTDNKEVEQYLEACGHDLATAVDLYFARDITAARSNNGQSSSRSNDVVMLSDDDEDDVQCVQSTSASSRRIAHSANGSRRPAQPKGVGNYKDESKPMNLNHMFEQLSVPNTNDLNEPEVRAPIPSSFGPLVHHSFSHQYGQRQAGPRGAFNQDVRDYRAEAVAQERALRRAQNGLEPTGRNGVTPAIDVEPHLPNQNGRNQPKSLQSLFRPPVDIMFVGDWENAKSIASRAEKWLLVNIQDVREFNCQTLNRDVWANSGVKELVKTNFIFWQMQHDSVDGERICNYYRIQTFPSIFVVDPRTGELVTTIKLNKQDPMTFCDSLATFLDQFPDLAARDRLLTGAVTQPDAFGPGDMLDAAAEPECSRSVAVSQQMEEDTSDRVMRKRKRNGEEEVSGKRGRADGDMPNLEEMLNEDTRSLSVVDKEEWKKEISPNGDLCRLRLKLPDGKLHNLEITDQSPLKALVLFIAGLGVSGHEHLFVLSFPRREYSIDYSDRTLKELGFSRNEMVHVELK